jgi:hypothetical protein
MTVQDALIIVQLVKIVQPIAWLVIQLELIDYQSIRTLIVIAPQIISIAIYRFVIYVLYSV